VASWRRGGGEGYTGHQGCTICHRSLVGVRQPVASLLLRERAQCRTAHTRARTSTCMCIYTHVCAYTLYVHIKYLSVGPHAGSITRKAAPGCTFRATRFRRSLRDRLFVIAARAVNPAVFPPPWSKHEGFNKVSASSEIMGRQRTPDGSRRRI